MASRALFLSSLLSLSLLAPGAARAQDGASHTLPSFELERVQLDPGALGTLLVGTGRTLGAGDFRGSVQLQFEHLPLDFSNEWAPTNNDGFVKTRSTAHVTAAYGVLPWLQVGAQVPFIFQQSGYSHLGIPSPKGSGLGTPWVGVRAALLRMEAGAPLNLGLDLTAGLPVGSEALLARDEFAVLPSLQGGYMTDDLQVGGQVGLMLRKRQDLSELAQWPDAIVGDELRLGLAVTSRGGSKTRGEVSALMNVPLQGGKPGLELLIGIRRHLGKSGMDLYILGGPGLGSAFDLPTFRLIGGFSFGTGKQD